MYNIFTIRHSLTPFMKSTIREITNVVVDKILYFQSITSIYIHLSVTVNGGVDATSQ